MDDETKSQMKAIGCFFLILFAMVFLVYLLNFIDAGRNMD